MALNTKLKNENKDFECHNCEEPALNAKKWRDSGFEHLK